MIDPRFEEVLDFIDEVDEDGKPSKLAMIAIKIQEYAQDVDEQRSALSILEDEIDGLQTTVAVKTDALEEQAKQKFDLVAQAQDSAVRAALAGSGGASASMRKTAQETRNRVKEFEKDFEQEQAQVTRAEQALAAKTHAIKDQRGIIVRRLNTMSSLAERAGLEFGTELTAQPKQPTRSPQTRPRPTAPRGARRRPRQVVVRRRKAS